jgi:hypothetical protein
MGNAVSRCVKALARACGLEITRARAAAGDTPLPDVDAAAQAVMRKVRPFTMTSPERLYALIEAVRYVVRTGVAGDIVECGVWRGGSMMAAALTLLECGETSRVLHLFDTFEGMVPPTARDVTIDGQSGRALLASRPKTDTDSVWCCATLDQVRAALSSTGYDAARVRFVKGRVEDTIPGFAPAKIAILRLDTDWYESTRHELEHLFPRLEKGGVLIIDDYGHWRGAREAVDEYVAAGKVRLLLARVDYTGRIGVKVE